MICGLKGKIESVGLKAVEVGVHGVFYRLFVPKRLLSTLVAGEEKLFKTYMHVTEDRMSLYGFELKEDVDMFRMLVGVSGVGPKSAVLILDENKVRAIKSAVIKADVDFFQRVKGLGKKTAQKIIIDLKSKVGSTKDLDLTATLAEGLKDDEVYLSLVQLGFDRKIVVGILKKVPKNLESTEDRLEWCLKNV